MSEASLSLVVIRTARLERLHRFYTALGLAFIAEKHGTGPEHLACDMGSVVLELYPARDATPPATRLGFRVTSVDDAVAAATRAGGTVTSPPRDSPWGRRAVLADPDGRAVEVTEPAETA